VGRRAKATRADVLELLARVGREHSDATVLFHAEMASFLGLHPTDYKTLSVLQRLGPMTAGDIARHTGLAMASVTNLIDRLEHKGFARRATDPGDRRRVLVAAREERVNAARQMLRSPAESLAKLFEGYSTEDLGIIADFLGRNAARLRAETAKLHSPRSHLRDRGNRTPSILRSPSTRARDH
jgi:DNA-binding MarR family transcriptional regulator